ncbi:MAG: hypothetical protein H7232_08660 [Aeromicrobium sp.]|nr:hypothetical protein [Burkholderiales bacterium]
MMNNPFSERRLGRMFTQRGLSDLAIDVRPLIVADVGAARQMMRLDQLARETLAAGVIDPSKTQRWEASLMRASDLGAFFASVNVVLVSGLLPPRQCETIGGQAHE